MMREVSRRWDEARLALMFFTRLPVGPLKHPPPTLGEAQWAYSLVGLVTGTLGWAVLHGALFLGVDSLSAALVALGAMALLTGGLHHDGLADFADGIGGCPDRARCLEIMRDSRIGTYGVLALIVTVGVGAAALGEIAGDLTLTAALLVSVVSRLAMLGVLIVLPATRGEGLGHGAAIPPRTTWLPGAILVAVLAVVVGWPALLVFSASGLVALLIGMIAYRRIGGQTGDVLGAVQLVSEAVGWLALSVAGAT